MSKVLPERIDIARLADSQATLEGSVPVARFARLADQLASREGSVEATFVFGREDGREVVSGRIEGRVTLVCQRCLGSVVVPVVARVDLVRVADDAGADEVEGTHDPFVAPTREVVLTELVEDELILALPLVPMHQGDAGCAPPMPSPGEDHRRESPFAALASMKKKPRLKKN
jgi:uncharacterized protein